MKAPAAEAEAESEAEWLDRHGLPDPDTLGLGDDFRAFLRQSVPKSLKRRALRRLWRSDPRLACLDGLVDYDDDYTDAATVLPLLNTAWRVGEGFARAAEKAAKAAEALADGAPPAPVPATLEAAPPASPNAAPSGEDAAGPAAEPPARLADGAAGARAGEAVLRLRRAAAAGGRMRFTTPEASRTALQRGEPQAAGEDQR